MHEIIKIPLEQMYKKDTSSTKTTEKVGGHCRAAKPMTNEHLSELHLKIFLLTSAPPIRPQPFYSYLFNLSLSKMSCSLDHILLSVFCSTCQSKDSEVRPNQFYLGLLSQWAAVQII